MPTTLMAVLDRLATPGFPYVTLAVLDRPGEIIVFERGDAREEDADRWRVVPQLHGNLHAA